MSEELGTFPASRFATADSAPLRVAVVGAGPAGVYTADILMRQIKAQGPSMGLPAEAQVDLFEKLPVPFGLVRYGVAPDHPSVKFIMGALEKTLNNPNIRLFADVEFGKDVTLPDLQRFYDAVIFATGAVDDRPLRLKGHDLQGVYGAAKFVEWYDGYPDAPLTWPLTARKIAVIGGGNVAMDVSRLLVRYPQDLLGTDIPDNVYQGLDANQAQEVHVFVRRDVAHAKFSVQELREMEELPGVQIITDDADFELSQETLQVAAEDKLTRQMVEELFSVHDLSLDMEDAGGADFQGRPARRKYYLHFNSNPVEILGEDGEVRSIRIERTQTSPDGRMISTGEFTDYPVDAVYHAIGYKPAQVVGIPYDESAYTLRNEGGRIVTGPKDDGGEGGQKDVAGQNGDGRNGEGESIIPFTYATGWAKRGPVGLIGSTKSDALDTVSAILNDWAVSGKAGHIAAETDQDPHAIERFLADRGIAPMTYQDWRRVDQYERSEGAKVGREHIKVVSADQLRAIGHQTGAETSVETDAKTGVENDAKANLETDAKSDID